MVLASSAPTGSAKRRLRALLSEFEVTQWQAPASRDAAVITQASRLVDFARSNVPFYRGRYPSDWTIAGRAFEEAWQELPILSRQDVQFASNGLHAESPLAGQEPTGQVASSGSTGRPVLALTTPTTQLFWKANTLRDHFWHHRDFRGKLAAIKGMPGGYDPPAGQVESNWGDATRGFMQTGTCAILDVRSTVEEQASWLAVQDPDYLLTHPSVVRSLASHFLSTGRRLSRLREVRTFGEVLDPEVRTLCRKAWGAVVSDAYSAAEIGYLALQCPCHDHYHVLSESVLVEVLNERNHPCQPGEIGRVVVTTLVNFAMPLIRYEIGDYAEVGEPCPCGRSLPVLNRILGRQRNVCVLPDGTHRWPSLSIENFSEKVETFPPIQQFQLIQRTAATIELRLVMHRALESAEEQVVRGWVTEALGHPFELDITYVDSIPRSAGGKFEDFRCEVGAD